MPASMRARVAALRQAERREPSWERMCRVRVMVEWGKRWVSRLVVKAVERVCCISAVRLIDQCQYYTPHPQQLV